MNQVQYKQCGETNSQMDYICTYPECLKELVVIGCHECLVKNHMHYGPKSSDHIIKLQMMVQYSDSNIINAMKRLQSVQFSESRENKFTQLGGKICEQINRLQTYIEGYLQKIKTLMLNRLEDFQKTVQNAEEELKALKGNTNYEDLDKVKVQAFMAISTQDNILPTLSYISLRTDDLQDFIKEIETSIKNLDKSAERLQTIKLDPLKIYQYESEKEDLQRQMEIQKNEANQKKKWKDFIKTKTTDFESELSQTINVQLFFANQKIKERFRNVKHCNDSQQSLLETSSSVEEELNRQYMSFLGDIKNISEKILITTNGVSEQKNKVLTKHKIDQKISKEKLNSDINRKGKNWLFKLVNDKNSEVFEFEVNEKNFEQTEQQKEITLTLGSKDKKNYIKFKQSAGGILYELYEMMVDGTIIFSETIKTQNKDIHYMWEMHQVIYN